MGAKRKAQWSCSQCKRINDGPVLTCPSCGSPRSDDEGEDLYLPDGAPEVTNPKELAEAELLPNRTCGNCGSDNRGEATNCKGCGAAIGVDDHVLGEGRRSLRANDTAARFAEPAPVPVKRGGGKLLAIIGSSVAAIVLLVWYLFFHTSTHPATVVETKWMRTIRIEKLVTEDDSGWSVPEGGRVVKSYQKVRSYRQVVIGREKKERTETEKVQVGKKLVKVGSKNLKNGYFEDIMEEQPVYENRPKTVIYYEDITASVPVHDTFHEYKIDRWRPSTPIEASGSWNPSWPVRTLAHNEREQGRAESYTVVLDDNGTRREADIPSEAKFLTLPVGTRCTADVTPTGRVRDVHPE